MYRKIANVCQLVKNGNFVNDSNWSGYSRETTLSFINNKCLCTCNTSFTGQDRSGIQQTFDSPIILNHKMLLFVKLTTSKTNYGLNFEWGGVPYAVTITDKINDTFYYFYTATNSNTLQHILLKKASGGQTTEVGDTWEFSNCMLIDLTEMYGAGNEPTTVEQFKQEYPNDYYPYAHKTWVQYNKTRFIGTTKNLFDIDTVLPNMVSPTYPSFKWIKQSDGSYRTGNAAVWQNCIWFENTDDYEGQYYLYVNWKNPTEHNTLQLNFEYSDGTKSGMFLEPSQDYHISTLTSTLGKKVTKVTSSYSWGDTAYIKDMMICKSSQATPYIPYGYAPYSRTRFMTDKYATIDLGTLNWTLSSGTTDIIISSIIDDLKTTNPKIFCSKYKYLGQQYESTLLEKTMIKSMGSANSTIRIKDSGFTGKAPAEFKALLQGVKLTYELETPITQAPYGYIPYH